MGKRRVALEVAGISFKSITAAAQHFGVSPVLARSRRNLGWPLEQVFELKLRVRNSEDTRFHPVVIEGQQYANLREAALACGVPFRRADSRVWTQGWSIEEALGLKPRRARFPGGVEPSPGEYSAKCVPVRIAGRKFESLRAACEHHGMKKATFFGRLYRKWTLEQALGLDTPPNGHKRCMGRVYEVTHLESGMRYIGITRTSVVGRWQEHVAKASTAKDVRDGSLHEAIRRFGAEAFKVGVLEIAHTEAELCATERRLIHERDTLAPAGFNLTQGGEGVHSQGIPVFVKGIRYDSIRAACRAHGLEYALGYGRLNRGWSLEKALTTAPKVCNETCPRCQSGRVRRDGINKQGIQAYHCNGCSRQFTALTKDFAPRVSKAIGKSCPRCQCSRVSLNGHTKTGRRQYFCKGCSRSFVEAVQNSPQPGIESAESLSS